MGASPAMRRRDLGWMLGFLLAASCPAEHSTVDSGRDATTPDAGSPERTIPPECQFEGLALQQLGEGCGCIEDCHGSLDRCERNIVAEPMSAPYCTTGCRSDRDCSAGYGCFEGVPLLGQEPFCQRCVSSVPATASLGERCICSADCQPAAVDGHLRDTDCVAGVCAISPCSDRGDLRCPLGSSCEQRAAGVSLCVECLNRSPAGQGTACSCAVDCQPELECIAGTCRRRCADDLECDQGQECREQALGGGLCTAVSEQCTALNDHAIGERCACNADCAEAAPSCVTLELGPFPATMCTLRPCDPFDEDPCPEGAGGVFRCCLIPTLLPATCVPPAMANLISSYALCSP